MTPSEAASDQGADRHKPRRMVAFSPMLYRQIQSLADRHKRPVTWQIRLMLEEALEREGLWPPKP